MNRVIGTMGDKLLGFVLREQMAGACIPEHGQWCACRNNYRYVLSCTGQCVNSGLSCWQ
ncbi:hypothetical protein [Embleya sp. NPDC059237]|uniref:hypothetical protein n=1 Tax=Embleya sp. NPDC059237 TaxID=3346784 RepID=UPI0036C38C90